MGGDYDTPTLAITGGQLVDGYGGLPVHNAVVLVTGVRITGVGNVNSVPIPDGVKPLDVNGMTILPGLWESHGHLFHIGEGDPATLPGVREHEGPFGEYTGYYTQGSSKPVMEVSAITHRHEAICQE